MGPWRLDQKKESSTVIKNAPSVEMARLKIYFDAIILAVGVINSPGKSIKFPKTVRHVFMDHIFEAKNQLLFVHILPSDLMECIYV